MPEDSRERSDRILAGLLRQAREGRRGRLRIFFGMSPGVGKTFAMLRAARDQKAAGRDVLVALVETHGRDETAALLEGFEVLPRKAIPHRGAVLDEMDLDGILARKPDLVLIDELAHSNVPGSRHPKRYQDVDEVLRAGIDVYTTMNVQHLESRSDLVARIVGAVIRETVPDSLLAAADQIELIDLSPEELLKRLQDGKVYLGERADRAAQGFFKPENLAALRELALRFTAEKVEVDLQSRLNLLSREDGWNTSERLMVAVSHSPSSLPLIRATRRLAFLLEAPWVAVSVDVGMALEASDEAQLKKNIETAQELGAEIVFTKAEDPAEALARIARERNVTQIVIGRPAPSWFSSFRGDLVDRLLRRAERTDVLVLRSESDVRRRFRWPGIGSGTAYWNALWAVAGWGFVGHLLKDWLGYQAVGFLFLAGVLACAAVMTVGPTLLAAALSAVVWNFFFIPPVMTFAISAPADIMMVLSFFVVAVGGGWMTSRLRRQEQDLEERETKTRLLYELTRDLSQADGERDLASTVSRFIETVFGGRVEILRTGDDGRLRPTPLGPGSRPVSEKDFAVAAWALTNGLKAGWGTETLSSAKCVCLPLTGSSGCFGVLLFYPEKFRKPNLANQVLLETAVHQYVVAVERFLLADRARTALVLEESERLHQVLLSSVSHELRTPMTSLIGTASALADVKLAADPDVRARLTEDLSDSTERLTRVVDNLLDMSRLNSGALRPKMELLDLNEAVFNLLRREARLLRRHVLESELSAEPLYVQADERLLETILVNLLANAATYAPVGTSILVRSCADEGDAVLDVVDQGPGLPLDQVERIFERFYRLPSTPSGGTGLGLSIVRGLAEAQGARVTADNRQPGPGAIFTIRWPLKAGPPKQGV